MTNKKTILKLTELALLTAIVIVLQLLGNFIHIGPTSITLVLIPIVLGAIVISPLSGAFLGLVFGLIVIWGGVSGTDPFTNILFAAHPVFTTLICLGKGALAGLGAGYVYKLFKGKNEFLACVLAAASAPIINTGLFILGGLFLVSDTLNANFVGESTLVYFLIIGCAGLNFIAEFIVNIIVSPAIHTTVNAVKKRIQN